MIVSHSISLMIIMYALYLPCNKPYDRGQCNKRDRKLRMALLQEYSLYVEKLISEFGERDG